MILYYILVPLAWLLWHIGFRIHVEGRENLKKVQTKGCILAPTHVSAIAPVFIVVTRWGRRMIVFAKKELFEINALLTWFFRCCGAVCVRGTKDEMAAIEQTVEKCRNGETLLIFPEGTREKDGKLLPPKSGLFVIAAGAGVDMIAFRRLVPQSSVDNADNAGVCEIADQSPDTLLELDNHFGDADIHQSVLCDGTLILDNWIGDRERKPENDHIGKAFSFNADTFPICARPQKHGVRIFLKLIQHLVLR